MTDTSKTLSLEEAADYDDTVRETVNAFGGVLTLVSLDGELLAEYLEVKNQPGISNRRANAMLIVYCLLNDEQRAWTREQRLAYVEEMAKKLMRKRAETLATLVETAVRLNGLSIKQRDDAKNGSGGTPSSVSPTA